jgi:hypothetical protein
MCQVTANSTTKCQLFITLFRCITPKLEPICHALGWKYSVVVHHTGAQIDPAEETRRRRIKTEKQLE